MSPESLTPTSKRINPTDDRTLTPTPTPAIVIGHVAGVVLAHDRAVRLGTSARTAQRSQYPLLAVMVAFTTGGLTLLLG